MLKFMSVDQFLEVYVGEKRIYTFGNPASQGKDITFGNTPHLVALPALHLPTPLCFRVFSRTGNVGINGDVWLGNEKDLITLIVRHDLSRVILISLYLVCALALIGFYFIRTADRGFLFWGLYIFSFSVWLLTQTEIKQLIYANALVWRIVDYASLFLLPVWIALFVEHIFGAGWKKIMRRMRQLHTLLACAMAALMITQYIPAEQALLIIQIGIAIQLITFLLVLLGFAAQGDIEARIFFGAAIAFGLTGLHDILAGLTLLPWSLPISIWGTLLMLAAAIAILVRRTYVLRQSTGDSSEKKAETYPLFVLLQTKFGLTYQEAQICAGVDEGLARSEIASKLGIQANTLKIHLRSIYRKTIEHGRKPARISRDKLQRLTVFLQRLQARSQRR